MHYRYKFEASELKTILRSKNNQSTTTFLNSNVLTVANSLEKEYECPKNVEFHAIKEEPVVNLKYNNNYYFDQKENLQCNAQSKSQYRDIVVDSQEKSQDIQAVVVKSERTTKSGIIIKKIILPSRQINKE